MSTMYQQIMFGHKLPDNLSSELESSDFYFAKTIGGINFEINYPYGGDFDATGCFFGATVTDTFYDNNWLAKIRNANSNTYLTHYNQYVTDVCNQARLRLSPSLANKLANFLFNNNPDFYSVDTGT